eukprot:SAG11_NODE_1370_length_5096_cov_2.366620_4_plen_133_part_00
MPAMPFLGLPSDISVVDVDAVNSEAPVQAGSPFFPEQIAVDDKDGNDGAERTPYISLVIMAAYEMGRKESNINAYIGHVYVERQLETLGDAGLLQVRQSAVLCVGMGTCVRGMRRSLVSDPTLSNFVFVQWN